MKKSLYVILLMTIFVVGSVEVSASSGKLRSASIKTCGGITYGQHSSDNHWHIAKNTGNGWYPDGDAIYYSDSCSSNNSSSSDSSSNNSSSNNSSSDNSSNDSSSNNSSSNNNSNSETSSNNSSSSSSNNTSTSEPNSSSSTSSNYSTEKEEIKSNNNTLKTIIINDKNIKIEENMSYSTTDKKNRY